MVSNVSENKKTLCDTWACTEIPWNIDNGCYTERRNTFLISFKFVTIDRMRDAFIFIFANLAGGWCNSVDSARFNTNDSQLLLLFSVSVACCKSINFTAKIDRNFSIHIQRKKKSFLCCEYSVEVWWFEFFDQLLMWHRIGAKCWTHCVSISLPVLHACDSVLSFIIYACDAWWIVSLCWLDFFSHRFSVTIIQVKKKIGCLRCEPMVATEEKVLSFVLWF